MVPLALAQAFRGVTTIYNAFLAAHAVGRALRTAGAVLTASNLVLNLLLIPPYGATGAAWASVLALVANLAAHVFGYRRYLARDSGPPSDATVPLPGRSSLNSILRIGPHPIWITRFALHHLSTRARQRVLRARYTRVVATTRTPELRGMPVGLAPAGTLPPGLLRGAEQVRREADSACEHVVDLLGSGPTSLGRDIDWHRDFKSGYRWPAVFYQDIQATRLDDDSDAKVPWELSRGHQLVALARASVLFEEDRFAAELEAQIRSWIDGNPTGVGINWQNAMETALRAVSWVWAIGTLEGRRPLDPTLRPAIARSLASHGRHIEHNLEGTPWVRSNHYMADLLGLLVLGWALPDDPRARRWWRTAHNGFEREIAKQVYDDGVDFEASLPYHGLVLEMLLLAAWVARRAGRFVLRTV